ncbi:hypothetical protein A1O1_06008 [Capronia coronata CBS 617.96]|uniref:Chromatin modification-related protein EAF3 n=1 Tax=Capronia coronata CBS 617.96 TaxID=1182541 RepID=W9XYL3_9EURO|nr:uncharacterized protein A1O1_06008 [Capronia coronata CBS 617.96]EXJ85642.1 hypothetical protein A1O1_06008 [Capronia coronata CBS 617.96]
MAPQSNESKPMYQKDEKALCFHGELLYEAKVLDVRRHDPKDKTSPHEYRVHYKGWKNTWDDWVPQDRLRKLTDDNRELAANLRRELAASAPKVVPKSATKPRRGHGSEIGSGRGSEERTSSGPAVATGRGSKRTRDNDIEKVGGPIHNFHSLQGFPFTLFNPSWILEPLWSASNLNTMAPKKKNISGSGEKDKSSVGGVNNTPSGLGADNDNNKNVDEDLGLQQFLHQPRRAAVKAAQAISNTTANKKSSVSGVATPAAEKTKGNKAKRSEPSTTGTVQRSSKNIKTTGDSKPKSTSSKPTKTRNDKQPGQSQTSHEPNRRQGGSTAGTRRSLRLNSSSSAEGGGDKEDEVPDSEEDAIPSVGRSVTDQTANADVDTTSQEPHKPRPQLKAKTRSKTVTLQSSKPPASPATQPQRMIAPTSSSDTPGPKTFDEYLETTHDPRDELAALSIDEILARPAPPDEPEYISNQSASLRKRDYNVPLVGGTTTDEKCRIAEELAEACAAGRAHTYRAAMVPRHGVAIEPLDPPGSGTPFDALKQEDRLVHELNSKPEAALDGWCNQEALLKIPTSILRRLQPDVLARLPYEVLKQQPRSIQQMLPADAKFWNESRQEWQRGASCSTGNGTTGEGLTEQQEAFASLQSQDIQPLVHSRVPAGQVMRGLDFLCLAADVVESGMSDQVQHNLAEEDEVQAARPNPGPVTDYPPTTSLPPAAQDNDMTPTYHFVYIDWTKLFTACGTAILYEPEMAYTYHSSSEQEENFLDRPTIQLSIPDHLRSILVDDWENVTKSLLLVPLPSQAPANYILDEYFNQEKLNRRLGSPEADVLEELVSGLKVYFEKALGKLLLYRFERNQLQDVRKLWESGRYKDWEGKGPGDCYGAEHLTRMIVNLPEIVAQTNMDADAVMRLKVELSKLTTWLSRNSQRFFCAKYEKPSAEYIESAR